MTSQWPSSGQEQKTNNERGISPGERQNSVHVSRGFNHGPREARSPSSRGQTLVHYPCTCEQCRCYSLPPDSPRQFVTTNHPYGIPTEQPILNNSALPLIIPISNLGCAQARAETRRNTTAEPLSWEQRYSPITPFNRPGVMPQWETGRNTGQIYDSDLCDIPSQNRK